MTWKQLNLALLATILICCLLGVVFVANLHIETAGAADADTVEIFEKYGTYVLSAPPPNMHPIVLRVPDDFRYGSSKGATRDWGINILTYYPSFTSPREARNARFGLDCAGICNGRILIAIENRSHLSETGSPNMGDFIAKAQINAFLTPPYPPYIHVTNLGPVDGFSEELEHVTMAHDASNNPTGRQPVAISRYYFRKAPDHMHYDLMALCDVSEVDPQRSTCTLHFSLACNPAIYVTVNGLDSRYLSVAEDIRSKTDRFISGMVISPVCN